MSINLSGLPHRTDYVQNNQMPNASTPTEDQIYEARLQQLLLRVNNFFSRTGGHADMLCIKCAFLKPADKASIKAQLETKGYTVCDHTNDICAQ